MTQAKEKSGNSIMQTGKLRQGFESFRAATFPDGVGRKQAAEVECAFYAGALVAYATLVDGLGASPGDELTDADIDLIDGIENEIEAFGARAKQTLLAGSRQ